ncbi:hypothetical protein CUMW_245130 [Citrus unshiu]|uniref:Uncharacterized protein n=1 Tax=Citrus unshiu TaxID=55188 RepID=A0A2H5QMY7_CITUN|nr:hypothetical protein CUMW_245130 [Citrus unshiu]
MEGGIFPDNLLLLKPNDFKFWSSPMAGGMVPDNWLSHISTGMLPTILLPSRSNISRVVEKLQMHVGSIPPKLLAFIVIRINLVALIKEQRNFVALDRECGMDPVIWFIATLKYRRFGRVKPKFGERPP